MKPKKKIQVAWPKEHNHPIATRLPGTGYPFWRRIILGPSDNVSVICLCSRILVYHCHYVGGTYVPCLWDVNADCEHHGDESAPRLIYQGSAPVLFAGESRMWMLNVTSSALHRGKPPLEERADLLGRWLHVGRGPGGRNARMSARVGEQARGQWEGKAIPPSEIWRTQCNIWCVELVPRTFDGGLPVNGEAGQVSYPPLSE